MPYTKEELRQVAAEIEIFKRDPVYMVKSLWGVAPTEQQADVLMSVARPGSKTSASSGHGTGKSTTLAWLIDWGLICFDDVKIPCTAPTGHQLQDVLWAELGKWHGRMPEFFRDSIKITKDRASVVGAEATRFAVARTAKKENPDALQGFHADTLIFLVDEASGVHDKVFEVARGAMSTRDARVALMANPTKLSGYFYDSHHKNRELWKRLVLSCKDSPLADPQYILEMAEEYGEDSDIFRVRVLGLFPKSGLFQLIPLDLVEARLGIHLLESMYAHAPKIIGVDVARFGDDRSVVFLRQGLMSKLLWSGRKVDTMQLAGIVAHYEDEEQADAVMVDGTGIGAGVVDRGTQLGRTWINVCFGGEAINSNAYHNKRTEMWVDMLHWLEAGGALPDIPELRDDLVGPEYQFDPRGRYQLERKEDMKKRGIASPDYGDALATTFAFPVVKKQHHQTGPRKYAVGSGSDYNPLA